MDKVALLPAARAAKEDAQMKADQQATLVRVLEDLTARAKAGKVTSLAAVIGLGEDTGTVYTLSPDVDVRALLGTIEMLRMRIFLGLVEIPELDARF